MEEYIPREKNDEIDNEWTDSLEKLVRTWGENSIAYSWMHNRANRYYNNFHTYLNTTQIALAGVAAFGTFVNVECNSYLSWTLGGLAAGSAIFSSFISFNKFEEKHIQHKNASAKFKGFADDIRYHLALSRENRQNCNEFIKDCKEVYDSLISLSPPIPESIEKKYKIKFGKYNISHPEIVDNLVHIKIEGNPTPPDNNDNPKLKKIVSKWKAEKKDIQKKDFK